MPGLEPGIHVFQSICKEQGVDGRVKPGHDSVYILAHRRLYIAPSLRGAERCGNPVFPCLV
jgi:hypothetical protein